MYVSNYTVQLVYTRLIRLVWVHIYQAVTINANAWSDSGHAVNHIYDILYMMGRDDVAVGVGGEGGILEDGTILPNVGGYLPIIQQVYYVQITMHACIALMGNSYHNSDLIYAEQ